MKILLDSDVIISGLISPKGAGRFILQNLLDKKDIKIITSKIQIKEIQKVLKDKNFIWKANLSFWQKFKKNTDKVKLDEKNLNQNSSFVNDPNDKHIVSASIISKVQFLLTYNLKDYKIEAIKRKFNILVVNPGYFLQFWRQRIKNT